MFVSEIQLHRDLIKEMNILEKLTEFKWLNMEEGKCVHICDLIEETNLKIKYLKKVILDYEPEEKDE